MKPILEKSGLKGYRLGGAKVYDKHALIIINDNKARWQDIVALAKKIVLKVENDFNIRLEHEVRFFYRNKEANLFEII